MAQQEMKHFSLFASMMIAIGADLWWRKSLSIIFDEETYQLFSTMTQLSNSKPFQVTLSRQRSDGFALCKS